MKRVRIVFAVVMVMVAIGWLYLAIVGNEGHGGAQRLLSVVMALGWIGFSLIAWRDRDRRV